MYVPLESLFYTLVRESGQIVPVTLVKGRGHCDVCGRSIDGKPAIDFGGPHGADSAACLVCAGNGYDAGELVVR